MSHPRSDARQEGAPGGSPASGGEASGEAVGNRNARDAAGPGPLLLLAVAAGFWITVGVAWGTQLHYSALLSGASSSLVAQLRYGLLASAPWVPATFLILLLARRYPLLGGAWRRNAWIHLAALPAVALGTNLLQKLVLVSGGPGVILRETAAGAVRWIHVIALLYLVFVVGTNAVEYWAGLRRREVRLARMEARLAEARLQALTARLRPHFLFNVLHTVGQLWRSGRSEEADAMLDGLGALFRRVHRAAEAERVSLTDELDLIREYLHLERIRFADRLTTEFEIEPAARRCAVPTLILQPLVENAIQHGVSADSRAGRVVVRARRAGGRLVMEVEDDGPGPGATSGPGRVPRKGSGGDGLRIVRQRLAQLDPGARLDLLPGTSGRGTRARIEIPALDIDDGLGEPARGAAEAAAPGAARGRSQSRGRPTDG